MAKQLADQIQRTPGTFSELARRYSEDVATRDRAGSLGGISASALERCPEVLDALAGLRPGEVSRVVETAFGFHVFLRRVPPPMQIVEGARIVIGYDEAPWLGAFLARRPIPQRSRAQALALAQSVYERARSGQSFSELVAEYSDHREALRNGDFGAWSSIEPTPFPREVEVLQELAVGQVSPPLDSPFGVQIIQRTEPRPRRTYAMSVVEQRFDIAEPAGNPASREAVKRTMQLVASSLERDPTQFDALQREYCCAEVRQWVEGRGSALAEATVARLQPGQIAFEPLEIDGGYSVLRRMAPSPVAEVELAFELPAPEVPDLLYLAGEIGVSSQLASAGHEGLVALGLSGEVADQFVHLHEDAGKAGEAQFNSERVSRFIDFQAKIAALLGATRFEQYEVFLRQHYATYMLRFLQDSRRARYIAPGF